MTSSTDEDLAQLCLQVQPARSAGLRTESLKLEAEAFARRTKGFSGISITEGDDSGAYLSIVFAVEDTRAAWQNLRDELLNKVDFGSSLKECSIVVCTGEAGWDDYLLLSHFDPAATLDEQSEA